MRSSVRNSAAKAGKEPYTWVPRSRSTARAVSLPACRFGERSLRSMMAVARLSASSINPIWVSALSRFSRRRSHERSCALQARCARLKPGHAPAWPRPLSPAPIRFCCSTRTNVKAYRDVESRCRLARYSMDCYGYCLVAMGALDLVIEAGLSPYDIQALIPIIEAAGGMVTDWNGNAAPDGGQIIAAGDARVHRRGPSPLVKSCQADRLNRFTRRSGRQTDRRRAKKLARISSRSIRISCSQSSMTSSVRRRQYVDKRAMGCRCRSDDRARRWQRGSAS